MVLVTICNSMYIRKIEREAGMTVTEGNNSYNEHRKLKRYSPRPIVTYHKFMVVLTEYTVPELKVWEEQCNKYKLLWKLR